MGRDLTISQEHAQHLMAFAEGYEEEVAGRLLYRQKEHNGIVDSYYLTGSGTETSLTENDEDLEVVQTFLDRKPEWEQAIFHTHTQKTVDTHGEYFAHNWSAQDMENINNQLRRDPQYLAVLATPEKMLIEGKDNPELKVAQKQEETFYDESVKKSLEKIEDELGYERELDDMGLTRY